MANINNILKGNKQNNFKEEVNTFSQEVINNSEQTKKLAPRKLFSTMTVENVDNVEFESLPAGEYKSVIEKITVKTSTSGTPIATIQYKVVEGDSMNRKAYETMFFVDKEGNLNNKSVGKLANRIKVDGGLEELESKEATINILQAFEENEGKELIIDDKNGIEGIAGILKISEYTWVPTTGDKKGIQQTGQNFSFKSE